MKTLIVYESRYGFVKKAVDFISVKLLEAPEIMTAKEAKKADLDRYDNIIIGGSVMAGKVQKSITTFINSRLDEILTKRAALLIAAAADTETLKKEISDAFPVKLREKALYTAHAGYAFDFGKMNFLVRSMMKKMAKTDKNVEKMNYEELDNLVKAVNG